MTYDEKSKEQIVHAVLSAASHEIIESNGLLLLATAQVLHGGALERAHSDPIAVEATMNKRHVSELLGGGIPPAARGDLMECGRAIVKIWSERIALRFPGRTVAFYLGGAESVILRFHVRRQDMNDWADFADEHFLTSSRIEVYELHSGNLHAIQKWT